MKKVFKKLLAVLLVMFVLWILIAIGLEVAGIWRIEIGTLTMYYDRTTISPVGLMAVYSVFFFRDKLDPILLIRDGEMTYKQRKRRRRWLRLVFCLAWFAVYGAIFALGQINHWHEPYAYLGDTGLTDLALVYLYGVIWSAAISTPKPDKSSEDAIAHSLDSAQL